MCVAFAAPQGASGVHAVIMPRTGALHNPSFGMHGNATGEAASGESLLDFTQGLLRSGPLKNVAFVQQEAAVPAVDHGRVVLLDLLRAVHRDADADGDGKITHNELTDFLGRHRLEHLEPMVGPLVGARTELSFGDFKALLLGTNLLSLDDVGGEYSVHKSLVSIVTEVFFDDADVDGDGKISHDEVERMLVRLGLGAGDAGRASEALCLYDADGSGAIDKQEFQRLLLGEGLISPSLSGA